MSEPTSPSPARSYGCTFACGNPYDYVITSVGDMTTEAVCLPCFVRMATDMIAAVTNPDDPIVQTAVAYVGDLEQTPMLSAALKPRGKNAPVGTDDDNLIESFDAAITVDELPPEFR